MKGRSRAIEPIAHLADAEQMRSGDDERRRDLQAVDRLADILGRVVVLPPDLTTFSLHPKWPERAGLSLACQGGLASRAVHAELTALAQSTP
jgi:hypothetical protein